MEVANEASDVVDPSSFKAICLSAKFCSSKFDKSHCGCYHLWADSPVLSTVQLLWINFIMDTFVALALATYQPDKKMALLYGRNVQDDSTTASLSDCCHPCFPLVKTTHLRI